VNARVLAFCPDGSGARVVHKQLEQGLQSYTLKSYNRYLEYFYPLLSFYRYGQKQYDLVHCPADYAALLASKDTPLVMTFHNYVLDEFMKNYSTNLQWFHYQINLKRLTRHALDRASIVTVVSDYLAKKVADELNYKMSIQVIPNGIDNSLFIPADFEHDKKTINVLFSGNLTLRKGAHWLKEIAQRLEPDIKIICASGLRKNINFLLENGNIKIIDKCNYSDMPSLYQSSDILLMPSVREGFGLAIGEAMACGLPVVASNTSAIPELVHDSKGGFLCEIGDIQDFSEKINILAASKTLRKEMGDYNRDLIDQKYRLDTMLNSYNYLFNNL